MKNYWKEIIVSFVVAGITFIATNSYFNNKAISKQCDTCFITSDDGGTTGYNMTLGAWCTFTNVTCNGSNSLDDCYFYITSGIYEFDECEQEWLPTAPELWGCIGGDLICPSSGTSKTANIGGLRANLPSGSTYKIIWTLFQGGSCDGGGGIKITSQSQLLEF